jgi:hypothetical protein
MKKILLISISILFFNCSNSSNSVKQTSNADKTILQKIDMAGMGMLEDLKIQSVNMIGDNTYQATHTFTNPMTKREMRITRKYILNSELDSVLSMDDIKIEMKTEGEFKEMFK